MIAALNELKLHFEKKLDNLFSERQFKLHSAMHYAATNGGKRIRPFLCYLVGEALECSLETLDSAALAIEIVHCYSLVHDDLPAMDDDALRRGKPTCHIQFDEATAILVGDALQTLAFTILSKNKVLPAHINLRLIEVLSTAIGEKGMCLGQALDMEAENTTNYTLTDLEQIHQHKTGDLIQAAVTIPAIIAGHDNDDIFVNASLLGAELGLAFQIKDDLLDVSSDTATLGKPQGSDQKNHKLTYCKFYSTDELKQKLDDSLTKCLKLSKTFKDSEKLTWIIQYIFNRDY